MKRNEWEFSYPVEELQVGVAERIKHREARIKVWTAKQKEVMAQLKKSGIKVTQELAAQLYNGTNFGPRVQLDPEMSSALIECQAKIQAHREKLEEYERWSEILADQTGEFPLNYDDYQFFFGVA